MLTINNEWLALFVIFGFGLIGGYSSELRPNVAVPTAKREAPPGTSRAIGAADDGQPTGGDADNPQRFQRPAEGAGLPPSPRGSIPTDEILFRTYVQFRNRASDFGEDEVAVLVAKKLSEQSVPEKLHGWSAVSEGAARFLRDRWEEHDEQRRHKSQGNERSTLEQAWTELVTAEDDLIRSTKEAGFEVDGLRPKPRVPPAIPARLAELVPEDMDRAASRLLQALLIPPDEPLCRAIVDYGLRLSPRLTIPAVPAEAAQRLPPLHDPPIWEWICRSPHRPLTDVMIEAACDPANEAYAGLICDNLLRSDLMRSSPHLSTNDVQSLIAEAPASAVAIALRSAGSKLAKRYPSLGDRVFEQHRDQPDVAAALATRFAGQPDVVRRVFGGPHDEFYDKLRAHLLDVYIDKRSVPEALDVVALAAEYERSDELRLLTVMLLKVLMVRCIESPEFCGKSVLQQVARYEATLSRIASEAPSTISRTAGRALSEIRQQRETHKDAVDRQFHEIIKALKMLEKQKARANGAATETDRFWKEYGEAMESVYRSVASQRVMESMSSALIDFTAEHGRLPRNLNELEAPLKRPFAREVLYWPIDRIDDRFESILIAALTEPLSMDSDEFIVVLKGDGSSASVGKQTFSLVFSRNNAARTKEGFSPIEPHQLGPLADWADAEQADRTP